MRLFICKSCGLPEEAGSQLSLWLIGASSFESTTAKIYPSWKSHVRYFHWQFMVDYNGMITNMRWARLEGGKAQGCWDINSWVRLVRVPVDHSIQLSSLEGIACEFHSYYAFIYLFDFIGDVFCRLNASGQARRFRNVILSRLWRGHNLESQYEVQTLSLSSFLIVLKFKYVWYPSLIHIGSFGHVLQSWRRKIGVGSIWSPVWIWGRSFWLKEGALLWFFCSSLLSVHMSNVFELHFRSRRSPSAPSVLPWVLTSHPTCRGQPERQIGCGHPYKRHRLSI